MQIEQDEHIDPTEFHVPASDTKGHNVRQYFRCIPLMARTVEQLVQSKAFPYRTGADLIRHALHRHITWLNNLDRVSTVRGQVDSILEIMRDEEMHNDFELVFAKMDERINKYMANGDGKEAARLVLIISKHVREMPDGFWRDKYIERIGDKYSHIVGKVSSAKLGEMN